MHVGVIEIQKIKPWLSRLFCMLFCFLYQIIIKIFYRYQTLHLLYQILLYNWTHMPSTVYLFTTTALMEMSAKSQFFMIGAFAYIDGCVKGIHYYSWKS